MKLSSLFGPMFPRRRRQEQPEHRFWLELITAESDASRFIRYRRLIRFPQLTMPLIAALTPAHWKVTHTDEIVQEVDFDLPCDLVGITANTAPRWDLIKGRAYGKGVTIATRGCPFACDYCTIPAMYRRRMRYRPIGQLITEIRRMPGRALILWDDNIAANRDYAAELFTALAPLNRWWTSQATADIANDEELLRLAAQSGCKALFLGLESVSQESLDGANKRHNRTEAYAETIRRFHDLGIAVQVGTVFGFDHDDRGIFARTVDTFRSIAVDSATVSVLIPFPNTPLFKRLERQGRILTYEWDKYNGKKDVVFQPALMTPHELLMGTEWAARQFYSLPSIAERMWKSRTGLWWNVLRNLGYHFALKNFGTVGYNPAVV